MKHEATDLSDGSSHKKVKELKFRRLLFLVLIIMLPLSVAFGADTQPPTYSALTTSTTIAGASCSFGITANDNVSLSKYIFGTNNTGVWVNNTAVAFGGTPATVAAAKTLISVVGKKVGYRWYMNDTSNNWNNTGIRLLTTTGLTVTITASTPPGGTLSKSTGSYPKGSFTIEATPLAGYTFTDWLVNATTLTANPVTVTLGGATTVKATFTPTFISSFTNTYTYPAIILLSVTLVVMAATAVLLAIHGEDPMMIAITILVTGVLAVVSVVVLNAVINAIG
jgi:hypothetical protein